MEVTHLPIGAAMTSDDLEAEFAQYAEEAMEWSAIGAGLLGEWAS